MRHALLSRQSDSAQPSRLKTTYSGLRISQPGDAFEREADRVAATVASGQRIHPGMVGALKAEGIHRDPTPPDPQTDAKAAPKPNNYDDAISKVAEAFLKTQVGQQMVKHFTDDDPLVQDVSNFIKTPGGIVAAGAAATGVIATLAATHKPLPAQLPAIPLDKISSRLEGMKLQISYQGPVDHPTQAMLTLSYEGKSPDKKKRGSDSDKYRAETARMAADQDKFRAGMQPKTGPEADQQKKESQMIQDWSLRRAGTIPGADHNWDLSQMGKKYPQYDLHMRKSSDTTDDTVKKEETPVQRKAMSDTEVVGDGADVDAALHSSSHSLDPETRSYMESHIGFDFSKVRIHTDARAASSAKALNARAYTVGSDLVFDSRHYSPSTAEGRRLLAHELTHVVQQQSAPEPVIRRAPASSSEAAENRRRNAAKRAATEMFLDLDSPSEIQSRAQQMEEDFEAADASPAEYVALAQDLLHLRALLKEREAKAERDTDGALLDAGNAFSKLTEIGNSESGTAPKKGSNPWTKERPHRVEDMFPFDSESVAEWQGVVASVKATIGQVRHGHTMPIPAARHGENVLDAARPSEEAVAVTFQKKEGMTFQTEDGQRLLVWTVIRATRSGYTNKQITKAVEVLMPHAKPGAAQQAKPLHWVAPSNKALPDWQQQIESTHVGDKITITIYPSFNRDIDLALDWAPDPRGEMLDAYQQGVLDSSGGVTLAIAVFAAGVTALTAGAGAGLLLGGGDIAVASGAAGTVATEAGETSVSAATLGQYQLLHPLETLIVNGPGAYNTVRLVGSGAVALTGLYEVGQEVRQRGHFELSDVEKAADALSVLYFLPEAGDPVAMGRSSGKPAPSGGPEVPGENAAVPEPVGDIESPTGTPAAGAAEEPAAASAASGKQGSAPGGAGGVEAAGEPTPAPSGARVQSGAAGGSPQTAQGFVRQWFRSKVIEMFMRGTLAGAPATKGTSAGGSDPVATLAEKNGTGTGTGTAANTPGTSVTEPSDASTAAEGNRATVADSPAGQRTNVAPEPSSQQIHAAGIMNPPTVGASGAVPRVAGAGQVVKQPVPNPLQQNTPTPIRIVRLDNNVIAEVGRGNAAVATALRELSNNPNVRLQINRGVYIETTRVTGDMLTLRRALIAYLRIEVIDEPLADRMPAYEDYAQSPSPAFETHGGPKTTRSERDTLEDLPHIASARAGGPCVDFWSFDARVQANAQRLGVRVAPESALPFLRNIPDTVANMLMLFPELNPSLGGGGTTPGQ